MKASETIQEFLQISHTGIQKATKLEMNILALPILNISLNESSSKIICLNHNS